MVFTDRNVRRIFVLALFLTLLFLFRHLAVLLVFFVLFERALGAGAKWLNARFQVPIAAAVLGQIVLVLAAVGVASFLGYTRVVPAVPQLRGEIEGQFHHLREWLHRRGWEHTVSEHATQGLEGAQHYAGNVVGFLGSVGKSAVYVVIGLILSVVFLIENPELERWRESLGEDSPARILMRYFSYLCDAIASERRPELSTNHIHTRTSHTRAFCRLEHFRANEGAALDRLSSRRRWSDRERGDAAVAHQGVVLRHLRVRVFPVVGGALPAALPRRVEGHRT
jgi:hypothetical protein